MLSTIRSAIMAAITAVLVFGAAGQARATVLYTETSTDGPTAIAWEAPTFITPPTSGSVNIAGLTSCTVAGAPCADAPFLSFDAGGGGTPDVIEVAIAMGASVFGAVFLPSDFGAFGTYADVFLSTRGTLTVSAVSTVPEPGAVTLLAMGLAGLGIVLRTRRA